MKSIGSFSSTIKDSTKILEAIGENIIVADSDYNVIWINPKATELLSEIIPYFDIDEIEDLIGINMNHFHKRPSYQNEIMDNLTSTHSSRINIKNQYVADIVITPIKDETTIIGYVVMLMDVTTTVQEEKRKNQMIQDLSGPTLHVWDNTIAIPLIGYLDEKRFSFVLEKLMKQCENDNVENVIIDFSGIKEWNEEMPYQIREMTLSLSMMGVQCMIVGIKPALARSLAEKTDYNVPKFGTTKAAIKYIISQSFDV
ncbi:STAS domain-containing protein [Virgibacillus senegalensis]|uniref:STAS domain-containing protein n=1 Tax=Virgibacillus senegalensis TaxID=1499679 RepID=UPI00069F602C|nr:STAS domain-containing protein [Virgibacillus senegalensis]